MAGAFGLESREVIRIKVKKCDGLLQPEYKKLCVDPQLTSFEILRSLLARAFEIKGEFTVSYLSKGENGQDAYLSMLSDWDLDAAFLSASDPCLRLKVDLKPFEEDHDVDEDTPFLKRNGKMKPNQKSLDDWDIIAPIDMPQSRLSGLPLMDKNSLLGTITGTITSQVNKTVSQVTKAIGLKSEEEELFRPSKPPMTDSEFHNFLDNVGHLVRPQEFRLSVYLGGVEPSLRSVVWRHLLNIYPEGMTGRERFEYMKKKSNEYYKLREDWRDLFSKGKGTDEIKFITNMVKKDVLRTDRTHNFYAGSDENQNVLSLFNLLVTFALTHPDVSYCQGMSDLASPILVVQQDEAAAYICFCGLMKRLKANFLLDGVAMTSKFQHLALLLQHQDPDFYAYLKGQDASDMFFCYRWILLELKREFPFEDAMRVLEVMWSSLPPDPPEEGLEMTDPSYNPGNLTTSPPSPALANQVYMYMRLRALRKQAHAQPKPEGNNVAAKPDSASSDSTLHCHGPGIAVAVTPGEEKDLDPREYLPIQDQATQELLDKSLDIDRSLEGSSASGLSTSNGYKLSPQSERGLSPTENKEQNDGGEILCEQVDINSLAVNGSLSPAETADCVEDQDKTSTELASELAKVTVTHPSVGEHSIEGESNIPEGGNVEESVSSITCNTEETPPPPSSPKRPSHIALRPTMDTLQPALIKGESGVTERSLELNSCEEAVENPSIDFIKLNDKLPNLPAPQEFGLGNPFLMFLCLTLLVQQRDHIMRNRMDYNDLAMHFDKMVRQHHVRRVLSQAQSFYAIYLRQQATQNVSDSSGSDDVSV